MQILEDKIRKSKFKIKVDRNNLEIFFYQIAIKQVVIILLLQFLIYRQKLIYQIYQLISSQQIYKHNQLSIINKHKMTQFIQQSKWMKYHNKYKRKKQLIQELLEIPQQIQTNHDYTNKKTSKYETAYIQGYTIKQHKLNKGCLQKKVNQQKEINQQAPKQQKIKKLEIDFFGTHQNNNSIFDEYILEKYNANKKVKHNHQQQEKRNDRLNEDNQSMKTKINKCKMTSDKQIQFPSIIQIDQMQQTQNKIQNYLDYFESISQSEIIKEQTQSSQQKLTTKNNGTSKIIKKINNKDDCQNSKQQPLFTQKKSDIISKISDQDREIENSIKIKQQIKQHVFNSQIKNTNTATRQSELEDQTKFNLKSMKKQQNISFSKFQHYSDSQNQRHFNSFKQQQKEVFCTKNDDKLLQYFLNEEQSKRKSNSKSIVNQNYLSKNKIQISNNKRKSNKRQSYGQISELKSPTQKQELSLQQYLELEKFIIEDTMMDVDRLKEKIQSNFSQRSQFSSITNAFKVLNNKVDFNQQKQDLKYLKRKQ